MVEAINVAEKWEDELRAWKLDSPPIEEVEHNSYNESYDWAEGILFRLASGQFATIIDGGCSCRWFGEDGNSVKYYQNLTDALRDYNEWKAEEDKSTYWTRRE